MDRRGEPADALPALWHLATRDPDRAKYYPDRQGFDVNIGGDYSGAPPTYFWPYSKKNRTLETMPPGGAEGEYLTDRLTDESLKFLDSNKDRPFLLYLSHYAVHTPTESKQALTDEYKADTKPGRSRTIRSTPGWCRAWTRASAG